MKVQEWVNLGIIAGVGLLAYIAYLLADQPHYQITGGGDDRVWKIDTQSGEVQLCVVHQLPVNNLLGIDCDISE